MRLDRGLMNKSHLDAQNVRVISVPSLDIDCTPYTILIRVKCTDELESLSTRLKYRMGSFESFIILLNFLL